MRDWIPSPNDLGPDPEPPGVRLALIDDHAVVRAGLRRVLEDQDGWEVTAEGATLDQARRVMAAHRPDALVLDLNLAGTSSLEAIPELLERSPETRIVVLTMEAAPGVARQALRSGAVAYVLKEAAEEELVMAIRLALAGRTYLTPRIGGLIAQEVAPRETLSLRERQVLRLLALGHTNAEVADQLHLSRRTVETHRANIQHKLSLSTRAQLTRHALDRGLLTAH